MVNSADKNLISSKRLCIGCPFVLSDGDEKNPKSLKKEKCVRLLNYDTGYLHMSPQGDGEALQLAFLPHYSEDQTEKVESCLDLPKNKPIRNEDDLQLYEYDEKQTAINKFCVYKSSQSRLEGGYVKSIQPDGKEHREFKLRVFNYSAYVQVSSVIGLAADFANGLFVRVVEEYNFHVQFRKVGQDNVWLRFMKNGHWGVSYSSEKNQNCSWVFTIERDLPLPTKASGWRILADGYRFITSNSVKVEAVSKQDLQKGLHSNFEFESCFPCGNDDVHSGEAKEVGLIARACPLCSRKIYLLPDNTPFMDITCHCAHAFSFPASWLVEQEIEFDSDPEPLILESSENEALNGPLIVAPGDPLWASDSSTASCSTSDCGPFTLTNRRHHCRKCGQLYCGDCAPGRKLYDRGYHFIMRICRDCEISVFLSEQKGFNQLFISNTSGQRTEKSDEFSESQIVKKNPIETRINAPQSGDGKSLPRHSPGAGILSRLECKNEAPPAAPELHAESKSELQAGELAASVRPASVPPLRICMLVVGSRGDVGPFIAIALQLLRHGHRVRLATHETHRRWVTSYAILGLEFFPIGADSEKLMEYMTTSEGRVLPTSLNMEELKAWYKTVPENLSQVQEIVQGCWNAATKPDISTSGTRGPQFTADAIIANPVAYGHVHVAQALHIPLHLVFTMPWTSTQEFPHPLANQSYSEPPGEHNRLSYKMQNALQWMGMGDIINNLRERLGLEAISAFEGGASILEDLKLPFTFLWSPALVPKPQDWESHIDVVGFATLPDSGMPDWTPTADLLSFLAASKTAPFLLTLGSCVVADPAGLSIKIAEAAALAGVRIILQQGWAKLGIDLRPPPKHVFVLGPAPHSWLFPRCAAVIHHGGAGTTCAGLLAGLPTLVLPFFGDQPFWGEAVRKAGCGPPPLKANTASIEDLAAAFGDLLRRNNEMKICAQAMGAKIAAENGVDEAVKSFYRHLPVSMQCDLSCGLARVYCQDCDLKLSPVADVTIHAGAFRAHVRSPWRYVDYSVGAERATTLNAALAPVTLISSTIWAIFRDGPSSGAEQFKRVHEALSPVGSHSLIVQPIAVGAAVASGASRTVGMALWAGVVFLDKVGSGLGPEAKHIEQPQSVVQGLFQGLDRFTRGVWSGVTAPVTDTLHATAQNHYPWNIVGGACKGLANLVVQPLAGTLQLVSRPLMGITNQFKAKSSLRVGDDEVDQVSLEIDDQTRKVIVEKFVFTHFALTEGRKLRVRLLRGQNYQI